MSTGALASCPNLDEDVIFGNFDKNSSGWIWSDDGFLEATATTGWIPRRRARRSESSSSAEKSWCVHKTVPAIRCPLLWVLMLSAIMLLGLILEPAYKDKDTERNFMLRWVWALWLVENLEQPIKMLKIAKSKNMLKISIGLGPVYLGVCA